MTGAGFMECKAALTEANGDLDAAVTLLRKRGLASAAKKAGRTTSQGSIGSYIHMGGKIGVLVEVNCESDFVARTDQFVALVKEIAMHIAAADPKYVRRDEVPAAVLDKEKEIYRAQLAQSGKKPEILEKIIEGKLDSYYEQVVLVDQKSIRDPTVKVSQLIAEATAKMGENIAVSRFARFKIGEAESWNKSRSSLDYNSLPHMSPPPVYKRILLKLSGEALMGEEQFGIDPSVTSSIAADIAEIRALGVEVGVVIGGGNIFRGVAASAKGMDRATGDYMGMLATVINGLAMQDALEQHGVLTRVVTAIEMRAVAEPFIRRRAIRHLEKGRVVIFAAGTGNPYFTTDTAAALRAMEMKADVIMKGTKVDGIYTADPMLDKTATKFDRISYLQVIDKGLRVMDSTAITLCMDNRLPIIIFNLRTPGNLRRTVMGEEIGSLVTA